MSSYDMIKSFVEGCTILLVIFGIVGYVRQKNGGNQTMSAPARLSPEDTARYKAEYKSYLDSLPEVSRWIRCKRTLYWIYMAVWIPANLLSAVYYEESGAVTFQWSYLFVILFQMLLAYLYISPRGGWKWSLLWFAAFLINTAQFVRNAFYLYYTPAFFTRALQEMPLNAVAIALLPFTIAGQLALGVFLTIPRKSRDRSDLVQKKRKEFGAVFQGRSGS